MKKQCAKVVCYIYCINTAKLHKYSKNEKVVSATNGHIRLSKLVVQKTYVISDSHTTYDHVFVHCEKDIHVYNIQLHIQPIDLNCEKMYVTSSNIQVFT